MRVKIFNHLRLVALGSILFLLMNLAYGTPHGPETLCHPFSSKRNYDTNYKWFPIGWGIWAHDLWGEGDPIDPDPQSSGDWVNGYVKFLVDQNCYWINTFVAIPVDNRVPWGLDYWRDSSQWTRTATYKRFLDGLESIKASNGIYDYKGLPVLSSKLGPPNPQNGIYYILHSGGTWRDGVYDPTTIANITGGDTDIFEFRVDFLDNEPQLGGWMLCDEPYSGEGAEIVGERDYVHDELLYLKSLIINNDDNINDHPIHCIIRGWHNYDFDPCVTPQWIYHLDDLDVADYIHDDLYLADYVGINYNPICSFCVTRTKRAMKNLIEPVCNAPDNNIHAWLLWSQGYWQEGVSNPDDSNENGYMTEEQLRYVNYASWINGAQGAMFWNLSKSNTRSFERAKKVSEEAYLASKCLMESDSGISATITSTNDDDSTAQFILRRDPNFVPGTQYKDCLLLMVCNNSQYATNVWIQFPQNQIISTAFGINQSYNWSYTIDTSNNRFGVGLARSSARAFFIYIAAD
ncbi:MAG: hypothetical protein AB1656_01065 [Candidatus Omnitrophota bacterium]